MISQRVDYRRTKKRTTFFGMPQIPLIIILLLVFVLLILPSSYVGVGPTGKVIDNIILTDDNYDPGEHFKGNLNIQLFGGDLLPYNSDVEFEIRAIKCNDYYYCGDGTIIRWQKYNTETSQCEDVSVWVDGPWEECSESYTTYSCTGAGGECCLENGLGSYYDNLDCSAGDCWDECSVALPLPLYQAVSLSSTPLSGNLTSGLFNNVNGPEPLGSGLGFAACIFGSAPWNPATGSAISEPGGGGGYPINKPDLTVTDIYTYDVGSNPSNPAAKTTGSQSTYRLYAVIKNQGDALVKKSFTVIAEYSYGSSMPVKFYETTIKSMGGGPSINPEITIDMGFQDVLGKTVIVTVDSKNEISESNENNNVRKKSFGVTKPKTPEYCQDSDNGKNTRIQGVCEDSSPFPIYRQDACISTKEVKEYYCSETTNLCEYEFIKCSQGYGCQDGACIPENQVIVDCVDSDNGNDTQVQGTCTDSTGSYTDQCTDAGLEEWYCKSAGEGEESRCVSAYFDCYYGCESGSCKTSSYSCSGWNNIYSIDLNGLTNLKAPDYEGAYNLIVSLIYDPVQQQQQGQIEFQTENTVSKPEIEFQTEKVIMHTTSVEFTVNEGKHLACIDYMCVYVFGAGSDQCDSDSDCIDQCNEDWICTDWGECTGGTRTRACTDNNYCGTDYAKPETSQICIPGCVENWLCSDWSFCQTEGEEQTAVCEDLNKCNPVDYSYMQSRTCCLEDWTCEWSSCVDGKQTKICTDNNQCDTQFRMPSSEQRSCQELKLAWWIWMILIAAIVIAILAILFGSKRIPWPFSRQKGASTSKVVTATPKAKDTVAPELREYIKKTKAAGLKKSEIRKRLTNAGWPKAEIDRAL